jgi:tetratricopeptide (TPR) repeat protein
MKSLERCILTIGLELAGVCVPNAVAQTPQPPVAEVLTLTTSSPEAKTAWVSAQAAILRLDFVGWKQQVDRAVAADPRFALARAERAISLAGAEADAEIRRAFVSSGGATPAERTLIYAMNEYLRSRPVGPLMTAAAALVPEDDNVVGRAQQVYAAGVAYRVGSARALVRRNPASAPHQANLARSLFAPADSAEARRAAEEALRLAPRDPYSHDTMGRFMIRARSLADAAAHFRQALQLDPDYYWAEQGLALVSIYQKRFADAREHLARVAAAAAVPEHRAEARRLSALTHLSERNMAAAVRAMEEAARLAEADGRRGEAMLAHRHLATFAGVRKDEDAVRRHIEAQIRVSRPDQLFDNLHQYWIALAWTQAGRADLARQALDVLERENRDGDIAVAAANIQIIRGVVAEAEGKHEEALSLLANNGNHWAVIARYQALLALGRASEADRLLATLFDQIGYDAFSTGLPVARYRFGAARAELPAPGVTASIR